MRIVHFYFRPELSIKAILKRIVPRNCAANLGLIVRRQGHAQRALNVKCSEALPISDGGRDDSVGRAILVLAGGESGLKERRYDVLSMLLIGRKNPVLHEEAPITKSVLHGGVVMHDI